MLSRLEADFGLRALMRSDLNSLMETVIEVLSPSAHRSKESIPSAI